MRKNYYRGRGRGVTTASPFHSEWVRGPELNAERGTALPRTSHPQQCVTDACRTLGGQDEGTRPTAREPTAKQIDSPEPQAAAQGVRVRALGPGLHFFAAARLTHPGGACPTGDAAVLEPMAQPAIRADAGSRGEQGMATHATSSKAVVGVGGTTEPSSGFKVKPPEEVPAPMHPSCTFTNKCSSW